MNEIRPQKETDQENIDKVYWLINELIMDHPGIEPTLWAGAIWKKLDKDVQANPYKYMLKHMVDFIYVEENNELIVYINSEVENKDFDLLVQYDKISSDKNPNSIKAIVMK